MMHTFFKTHPKQPSTVIEDARRIRRTMSLRLAVADAATLLCVFASVIALRILLGGEISLSVYAPMLLIVALFPLVFALVDLYPGALLPPHEELKRFSISISACFLLLGTMTFFSRDALRYSRSVFFFAWIISILLIPIVRSLVRSSMARQGKWGIPAVLIGTGPAISIMARNVRLRPRIGLKIVGMITDDLEKGSMFEQVPVLGGIQDAESISKAYPGCYAIVSGQQECSDLDSSVANFDHHFSRVVLLPNVGIMAQRWAVTRDIGGLIGLEMHQNLLDTNRLLIKRTLDFCASAVALTLLIPLFLVIAVCIRFDSPGPVIFGHTRLGMGGRKIKVWKFRSMVCNGDEVLKNHLNCCEESRMEWEATQKLQEDPRITRLGGFLRRTSLDELPQLWNVLVGELSLVGPRPIIEAEKARYKDMFALYARIRPGITGLWQISGRNLTSYDQRIDLDSYYVRNWSIWFDIYILAKTVPVLLTGYGAF